MTDINLLQREGYFPRVSGLLILPVTIEHVYYLFFYQDSPFSSEILKSFFTNIAWFYFFLNTWCKLSVKLLPLAHLAQSTESLSWQ